MKKKMFVGIVTLAISLFIAGVGIAATTNTMETGSGFSYLAETTPYLATQTIDFSTINAETNDVYKAINITAPALVQSVFYKVTSALMNGTNAAVGVLQIGDNGSATRYADAVAVTAGVVWAGGTIGSTATHISTGAAETSTVTSAVSTGWRLYTADDSINVKTLTGDVDSGTLEIRALVFPIK